MFQQLLHTPDGVRDIYNGECAAKLSLQTKILEVIRSYGYRDIETPTFEYLDIFGSEVGTSPSKDLYKFFDREGNTLVLRPDITPSIARVAATYFSKEEKPIRFCYQGNTFSNNSSYQGRLRETTQIGAELIGDNSAEADAEMIVMVVESLLKAGLSEFQVSIGQAEFFRGVLEDAGMTDEQEQQLRKLILNKNTFGTAEYLSELNIAEDLKHLLAGLPQLFGSVEILDKAASMTENVRALSAIERMRNVYELIRVYGFEKYVSFDLGMIHGYSYYTGIIFQAYTFGTGDAIVKGGRYDTLLKHFGKEAPSVGFVVEANNLLNAMARQKLPIIPEDEIITVKYDESTRDDAIRQAMKLRAKGICVELTKKRG